MCFMPVYLPFQLVGVLQMAEGRDSNYLSPLEEQYIQEAEADGDIDQQLLRERELASQKLWLAFQDSATAVAHLFRGILDRPISSWKARGV